MDDKLSLIHFEQTIPLLRIFDVAKAREFYCSYLGMTVDWEHRFEPALPLYMQISRNGLVLHLTEHYGDCCPGATVFVWMQGVEELWQELKEKHYGYLRPGLENTPYGSRLLPLVDPFGNRLRLNARLA